jgi:hypothetical protein
MDHGNPNPPRIVSVVGGTGHLGRRAVAALQRLPGVEVRALSRRGPWRLDLTREETWGVLEGSALVVDLSDATTTPPDAWVGWCLARGLTVLEATSDAPCVERLHARFATHPGRLVLGAGIFTGASNLLARAAADAVGHAARLTLAISSSPFSGAGKGTIALMLAAAAQPVVRWVAGRRVVEPRMSAGPDVDFGPARRPTLRAPFAEAAMLHHSTRAPDVDVLFAPRPALLAPSFRALPPAFTRSRLGRALLGGYFTLLRRGLLRKVPTAVELWVRAEGSAQAGADPTQPRVVERRARAEDGMDAAAWLLAAMAEAVLRAADWRGVRFVDELCALEPIVARADALAGRETLRLS